MQLEKARMLREIWTARGSPACDHPGVDSVYYLAADTGDEACTTCGKTDQRSTLMVSHKAR